MPGRVELQGTASVVEKGKTLPERIRIVALVGKSGVVLYNVFVAPEVDFDAMRPTFERILQSYRVR